MSRFIMAGALVSAALGSVLALPVAAQAATSAPAAGIARAVFSSDHNVSPDLNGGGSWQLEATYPDTSAGLAACNTEGRYLITTYPKTDESYTCRPAYQLWIYFNPTGF
jgi:hypothetical protein